VKFEHQLTIQIQTIQLPVIPELIMQIFGKAVGLINAGEMLVSTKTGD
jgi:hypothetical protein